MQGVMIGNVSIAFLIFALLCIAVMLWLQSQNLEAKLEQKKIERSKERKLWQLFLNADLRKFWSKQAGEKSQFALLRPSEFDLDVARLRKEIDKLVGKNVYHGQIEQL